MNERFKELRHKLGLSQAKFAKNLGVTPAAINEIEQGRNKVTNQMIVLLSNVYNVNEGWLRTGDSEMFNSEISKTDDLDPLIEIMKDFDEQELQLVMDYIEFLKFRRVKT